MNFPKSELSKQDALHLWITCRSEYAKEQMFLTNYGIVFFVMRRLGIPAFDEDMFQIGSIGLLKAIDTFDASKGCFSTYAFPIVRNELFMEFRKSKKSVNAAFSLDDNVDIGNGESVSYAEMIADRKDYEENTVNSMLAQQIFEKLSPREQRIFIMFFVEGKTQHEISEALGISQSYISRIIKGIGKIKKERKKSQMRVISQDGTIDLPYEQVIITRHDKSIYLMEHLTNDVEIAKYSTEEKADEAMEELRMAYMCNNLVKMGQTPPDGIDEKLTMGLRGVFEFPADEELE